MNIGNLQEIKAMAVVSYDRITEQATNLLIQLPRKVEWNIRIFQDRDLAIHWLQEQLAD